MRRTLYLSFLAIASVSLAACSSEPAADSAVTETKMDAVDAVQGTISDEMIVTDDMADQAPVADASESGEEPAKVDKKPIAKPKPAETVRAAPKPTVDKAPAE